MKNPRDRRVVIQVEVSFKDADAVLGLVDELGLKANVTIPQLARANTVLRRPRRPTKPRRRRNKGYHKTSPEDVAEIFRLNKAGRSGTQIAAAIGCGPTTVRSVIEGRHYTTKKLSGDALKKRIDSGK